MYNFLNTITNRLTLQYAAPRLLSTTASRQADEGVQAKYFPAQGTPMLLPGTFDGKVAFVTGGGTGLGRAMATMLSVCVCVCVWWLGVCLCDGWKEEFSVCTKNSAPGLLAPKTCGPDQNDVVY